MTKTKDKSNQPPVKYNFSGWGNNQNIIKNDQPIGKTIKETAKYYNCSKDAAWRTHRLRERVRAGILKTVGDYDDAFRMRVCEHAVHFGSAKDAAKAFGCSKGSVYNWLKAYDNSHNFFHSK